MIDRDKTLLERMNEEISFIIKTTDGVPKDVFLNDSLLQHGVCMSMISIGECANHLSDEFTESYPEISWIQIVAVRNIAAHSYQKLNMEQIWEAIVSDVPQLRDFLSKFV